MTLFKTQTAQEIWIEMNCGRCWRDPETCPILTKALQTQRRPPQWERNSRAQTMADAYRCDSFSRKPPRPAKKQQFQDVSMFGDDTPYRVDVGYVPVEGWPDDPKEKKGTDHA